MVRSQNTLTVGTLFLAMAVSTFAVPLDSKLVSTEVLAEESKMCTTCEGVFSRIEDVFKSPALVNGTVNLVDELICDHVPKEAQDRCKQEFGERIPAIYSGIASHWFDPTTDCEDLHFCHKSDGPLTTNDLKCDICTKVAEFLGNDVLESEKVQTFMTEELDEVCGLLPEKYTEVCQTAANASVPELLSYAATFLESNACSYIGFCNKEMVAAPSKWEEFRAFMKQFGKIYDTPAELMARLEVFRDNLEFIAKHATETLRLEMNQYGDMTTAEFAAHKKDECFLDFGVEKVTGCKPFVANLTNAAAVAVDWRTKGAVTPVKDQGHCGSCWSFSATGAMEGAYFIKTGRLLSFAEQELVDCSGSFGNQGCNGGLMDSAFEYALESGMCTEDEEPYKARDEKCEKCSAAAEFEACFDVPSDDEASLMSAVEQQPVSIAIEADHQVFMFYAGGIIDDASCGTNLDHGVLVVGYGEENGKKFWIVKNSWGESWGENGYVRLARDETKKGPGVCGIASQPSFIVA